MAIILLINTVYYKRLYNNQIKYVVRLLDRQVQLTGLSVDNTSNEFLSDFNRINFDEDLELFFISASEQRAAIERMKLFFSKHDDFVTGIKLYDTQKNEFTLKKDPDTDQWLEQSFILHNQGEILDRERLVENSRGFEYFLPIIKNNTVIGNMVVTIDYMNYFSSLFMGFNLKDYQWQWVLSYSGDIIFENTGNQIEYYQLDKIIKGIQDGKMENVVHDASIDGKNLVIISSYYSTQLLQRDFGIVFSAPTDSFQKYIVKNSLFIAICSLLLMQITIMMFLRRIKSQEKTILQLNDSEKLLFNLIEDMPVGVIIYNKNREIIKANRFAAKQYSYADENEMTGQIFPEPYLANEVGYLFKDSNSSFDPKQLIAVRKNADEILLYRNCFPITLQGEEAVMEMLIDVIIAESEKKNEAKTGILQSDSLARLSYEIKMPLNDIFGMIDLLNKHKLSGEVASIVASLRQSSEILLKTVNDIFEFSKTGVGSITLEEISFNLRDELNYSAEQAKKSVTEKVNFHCNIAEDAPENIIGDQFRLRQILSALINHSIANTNEGEISLDCKFKDVGDGAITLMFTLADTGVLFDEDSIIKVFDEFSNFDINNLNPNSNIVFGAIIAKKLIEQMGGDIHAESPSGLVENRGLKVTFSIPVFVNNQQTKKINISNITTFKDIKALVITGQNRDEKTVADFHKIGVTLKTTTYQKFTINQIKNNLNFHNERYNLIVIFDDEDFNGFEVASEIWENNLSENFILLLITKNDKKGNYIKCVTLGVDQYLVKPFEISELIQLLKTCFTGITEKPILPKNVDKSNMKILIAEDNLMNQKIMGSMLKFLGYDFETANDGYEAYNKAEKQKYDLIIIDIVMPKMDGFEASSRIIEHDKDALIIAISADNNAEMIAKSKLCGIREFLPKPVRIEDLKGLFIKYFK